MDRAQRDPQVPRPPARMRALVRRRRPWHVPLLALIGVVVWMFSAPTADAQVLYEWREPSGTVVYSQMPPRPEDGVLLRSLKIAELPGGDQAPAARVGAESGPPSGSQAAWQRADARVAAALARLQAAERAAREGQEPRPGERRHLVNGHSRLTRGYFDRLSALHAASARARAALQAAYAERDALTSLR